jgi:hypothetical protein
VFSGFIAAWFLAASPIRRSSLVKETKEGVVKLPCSLATTRALLDGGHSGRAWQAHTDLDIGALVVGNARVGRAYCSLAIALWGNIFAKMRTKIDANGTLVYFVAHGVCVLTETTRETGRERMRSRCGGSGAFNACCECKKIV